MLCLSTQSFVINSYALSLYRIRSTHALTIPLFSDRSASRDTSNNRRKPPRSPGGGSTRPSRSQSTDTIRQARFARSLRDELSDIICNLDIKAVNYPDDELVRGTSIVDIEVSSDMEHAKIIISVLGNSVEKRQVYVWLCENVGQVRFSLAKRLRNVRWVPTLSFKLMDPKTAEMLAIMEEESMKRELTSRLVIDDDIEFDEDE